MTTHKTVHLLVMPYSAMLIFFRFLDSDNLTKGDGNAGLKQAAEEWKGWRYSGVINDVRNPLYRKEEMEIHMIQWNDVRNLLYSRGLKQDPHHSKSQTD